MLSFTGLSSYSTETQLQDFAVNVAQPAGRRSRTAGGGGTAACSIDGCRSDLSLCREYYRRHKVCEMHSKMAAVVVRGQEQRFCQQCSRFHMLSEFDGRKRSCRKRLAGHNRRRRKQKLNLTNLRGFIAYHQGNQFEVFSQTIEKIRQNSNAIHLVHHSQSFSTSLLGALKVPKQFWFAQDRGGMLGCPGNLLSGTLSPKFSSSLLLSSMYRPSPAVIPTAGQAQVASPVSCITATLPSTTTAGNTAFSSQEPPFPWQ